MPKIYAEASEAYPVWDFYTQEEKDHLNHNILDYGYVAIEVSDEDLELITKAFKDYEKADELITQKWKEQYPKEEKDK